MQSKGLPLQQYVGKPITDFAPEDLKQKAASPAGAPRVEAESGDTKLTSYDIESQLDPTYRATCLSITDGKAFLHLQDTNGDGKVDNACQGIVELRAGQHRASSVTLLDRHGRGVADTKVLGKSITEDGSNTAHALSQQFYEDGQKTFDTTQQIKNGKSMPLSPASFQAMFTK